MALLVKMAEQLRGDLMRLPSEKAPEPDAARWLAQAGIAFTVEPDGHLVVQARGETVDYWPVTQTWVVRGLLADELKGMHPLITFCRQPKR